MVRPREGRLRGQSILASAGASSKKSAHTTPPPSYRHTRGVLPRAPRDVPRPGNVARCSWSPAPACPIPRRRQNQSPLPAYRSYECLPSPTTASTHSILRRLGRTNTRNTRHAEPSRRSTDNSSYLGPGVVRVRHVSSMPVGTTINKPYRVVSREVAGMLSYPSEHGRGDIRYQVSLRVVARPA
jgi:hypothetical protein